MVLEPEKIIITTAREQYHTTEEIDHTNYYEPPKCVTGEIDGKFLNLAKIVFKFTQPN